MSDTGKPDERDAFGRYLPGNGGSHGGRKRLRADVREMLELATPKAAQRMIEALDATRAIVCPGPKNEGSTIEHVDDFDMRVKAATIIMDRIHGKAAQAVMIEDVTERGPLTQLSELSPEALQALQVLKAEKMRLEAAKKDESK